MNIHQVLLKPTITEKSTLLQESGRYTFQVALKANKAQVKEAIEKNFDVTVYGVNITKLHGKRKRYGQRRSGRAHESSTAAIGSGRGVVGRGRNAPVRG